MQSTSLGRDYTGSGAIEVSSDACNLYDVHMLAPRLYTRVLLGIISSYLFQLKVMTNKRRLAGFTIKMCPMRP